MQYRGTECIVLMLRKNTDPNINFPKTKIVWTISLTDLKSYLEDYAGYTKDPDRLRIYTGEVGWEFIKDDCYISNALDFIRDPE